MSDSHDFCRETLKAARKEAKDANIQLPRRITALQGTTCITRTQFFIEAEGVKSCFCGVTYQEIGATFARKMPNSITSPSRMVIEF